MDPTREAVPRSYGSYFFAVVLLVLILLGYLWGQVQTMRQGDEMSRLRAKKQALLRDQDRLRAEVAGLKQSSRIREIASKKLGMVFPSEPPRNLYLNPAGGKASNPAGGKPAPRSKPVESRTPPPGP